MAEIAEVEDLQGEFESVTADIAQQEQKSEPVPEKKVEDIIPEKYRGKTVEDLIVWHQEAEKKASRLGNEVGEVRKLADELLKSQLVKKAETEQPREVDFFENPQEAMRQAIDNSPKVKAAEEYALNAQRQLAVQSLVQKHPDYMQVAQDPEFNDWVAKSNIRKAMFQSAQNYDFEASDELLSTFKELRAAKQVKVSQVENKARDSALQAAAVETSGTSETTRKIYRRADLIRLRMQDPARYEAMSDEIYKAYAEDRVK